MCFTYSFKAGDFFKETFCLNFRVQHKCADMFPEFTVFPGLHALVYGPFPDSLCNTPHIHGFIQIFKSIQKRLFAFRSGMFFQFGNQLALLFLNLLAVQLALQSFQSQKACKVREALTLSRRSRADLDYGQRIEDRYPIASACVFGL